MRVLLLHPEDSVGGGPWSRERRDLIVDLGFASRETYEAWSELARARVVSIHEYGDGIQGYHWVNQVFEQGRHRLLDRKGLDWWDILAMEKYQDLHTLRQFYQLRQEIGASEVELATTRPHPSAGIAEQVFGVSLHFLERRNTGALHRVTRAFKSARNLRPAQIVEISLDKWDSGYHIRGYLAKRSGAGIHEPCILLPSAYSNVTRSVLAYAARLPSRRFFLVTTRRNAVPDQAPANTKVASLAAYVQPEAATREEAAELKQSWRSFSEDMQRESAEFRAASKAGVWDYFPAHLEQGLRLREAWMSVIRCEPVTGVLCGDDLNYHTRLPLILAGRQGLNRIYCSHGALDGGFLFKTPYADCYLVKGEMEGDYLRRAAAIAEEQVVVAAPGRIEHLAESHRGDALVFFSQPYEVLGGRAETIYREIIPRLYSAARATGRKLLVKLHPFESKRLRQTFIKLALPNCESGSVEVVEGVPAEAVMPRTWCGVTVDSSAAVECALRGVPFFLCGWLDFSGIGYLDQFARFGVAQVLKAPQDIERIPEMVGAYRSDPEVKQRLWRDADPRQLDEMMFGARQARLKPCAC